MPWSVISTPRASNHNERRTSPVMTTKILHKTCSKCNMAKPLSGFSAAANYKDGYRGQCKACRAVYTADYLLRNPDTKKSKPKKVSKQALRDRMLQKRYGLSLTGYEQLFRKQRGLCAICKNDSSRSTHRVLAVDHCHETGIVRGLLCSICNRGLSALGDTKESLMVAVRYLVAADRNNRKRATDPIDFARRLGRLL
jgi:hypothetical protein